MVNQRIERVEKFFLGIVLAAEKLNIVNHQDIDGAELFLERHRILEPHRPYELVHELFRGQIDNPSFRRRLADMGCDCMHQMSLAEPYAAIQEQRVERDGFRLCNAPGRGKRQFVWLADNKIVETEPWIKRRPDIIMRPVTLWRSDRRRHRGDAFRLRAIVNNIEPGDFRIFFRPQSQQPVAILGFNPVAHKSRGRQYPDSVLAGKLKRSRLQPTAIRRLAEFCAQA